MQENHLIRQILTLIFSGNSEERIHQLEKDLLALSRRESWIFFRTLNQHRLTQYCFYLLITGNAQRIFERPFGEWIAKEYLATFGSNTLVFRYLTEIINSFNQNNISYALVKGPSLIEEIYPCPGVRPMTDVDFEIRNEEKEDVVKIFQSLGYRLHSSKPESDAMHLFKDLLTCDVHHRSRLFKNFDLRTRIEAAAVSKHGLPSYNIYEPNTRFVHLIFHAIGHRMSQGYPLFRLVDIALVIRKFSERLSSEKISSYLSDETLIEEMTDICTFLNREFNVEVPTFLLKPGESKYQLDNLISDRRLANIGFPSKKSLLKNLILLIGYDPFGKSPPCKLRELSSAFKPRILEVDRAAKKSYGD